jgi:uncharacterized protein (DUF58 family)
MRRPLSTILPLLLPGTAFWTLVIIGIATGSAGVWLAAAVLGVVSFLGFLLLATSEATATRKTRKRVWAEVIPATAKVLEARANGSLNNHPYVDLTLEVTVPNQGPRTAQVRQLISQLMVGRIEPDKEIAVKVDPTNPAIVVVDPELTPYGY